eukprot:TRINITY_DN3998_c0_g1_i1.p1 TRINITY_DN3998_c0_g1~~TRINITY_DN3998_c0_g1_i1.p1  ORF type:complete len:127 (+),score=13.08 TRINITY_DN3998_c0_g1_i1:790-1170(+)
MDNSMKWIYCIWGPKLHKDEFNDGMEKYKKGGIAYGEGGGHPAVSLGGEDWNICFPRTSGKCQVSLEILTALSLQPIYFNKKYMLLSFHLRYRPSNMMDGVVGKGPDPYTATKIREHLGKWLSVPF